MLKKALLLLTYSTLWIFIFAAEASSDVIVHDMVVPVGVETMLMVETRGRFLSKGGEVVSLFIDGKSIGSVLSGGDGFAFKQFTPSKPGLYLITAKSDKDRGEGLLLSLKGGTGIVFVDVEGSLLEGPFSKKPKDGSQRAIKEIRKRFPVVFLRSKSYDMRIIKKWLKENGFVKSPVVSWKEGVIFREIKEKGFKIKAVIGGPQIIESAREYKPAAFSFEDAEDAVEVKDWEEIIKRLRRL